MTVTATDPDSKSDSVTVTISITNIDEPGSVTLAGIPPQVGRLLTATPSDPDSRPSGVTWQWERSTNRTNWTAIAGETSNQYRPGADDAGAYLRVTATYTDVHGTGQTARAVPTAVVRTAPVVTLVLSDDAIDEDGGVSTVTARLNNASSAVTIVTVEVTAGTDAVTRSGSTLRIEIGDTASTSRTVTLTAKPNTVDAPDTTVTVSGTATNSDGITGPASVDLTIADDDNSAGGDAGAVANTDRRE